MKFIYVLLALSHFGFAQETPKSNDKMETRVDCRVSRWGEHWVSGGRCYFNDVMTGFDFTSNSAICARLTVECPHRSDEAKVEEKKD